MICQAKSHSCIICLRVNARKDTPKQRAWEDPTLGENYCKASQSFCFFFPLFGHACQGIERSFSVFMTSTLPVLRVQRQHARKIFFRLCRRSGWTGKFFPMQLHTLSDDVWSPKTARLSPTVLRHTKQPCWEQHHPNWSRLAYRGDPKGRLHLRIYLLFVLQRNTTIGSGGGFHHGHRWRSACIGDLRMICTRSCVENQVEAVKGRSSWSGRKGVLVPSLTPWHIR